MQIVTAVAGGMGNAVGIQGAYRVTRPVGAAGLPQEWHVGVHGSPIGKELLAEARRQKSVFNSHPDFHAHDEH